MDTVTWPMVGLAAISALSGIIAAIGTVISATRMAQSKVALEQVRGLAEVGADRSTENKVALAQVHVLVNSRMEEMTAKLESALQKISDLTGERKKSVDEADTK